MPRRRPTEVTNPQSLGGIYAARFGMDAYRDQYEKGWRASGRTDEGPFQNGTSSDAYDDGYLDQAAGREKWHLTRCPLHDNGVPGGCNEA